MIVVPESPLASFQKAGIYYSLAIAGVVTVVGAKTLIETSLDVHYQPSNLAIAVRIVGIGTGLPVAVVGITAAFIGTLVGTSFLIRGSAECSLTATRHVYNWLRSR